MAKSAHNLTPFLLLCLIGFAAFFSSCLRIPVMPVHKLGQAYGWYATAFRRFLGQLNNY